MSYALRADLVLILHLLYVGFVVVGQLVIMVGACLRWQWVRNPWFRWIHLLAMAIVVFESLSGITCPLTTWEKGLRTEAGQDVELLRGSERMPEINPVLWTGRKLLFPGQNEAFYIPIYVVFFLVMMVTLIFAPPRWPRLRRRQARAKLDQSALVS